MKYRRAMILILSLSLMANSIAIILITRWIHLIDDRVKANAEVIGETIDTFSDLTRALLSPCQETRMINLRNK